MFIELGIRKGAYGTGRKVEGERTYFCLYVLMFAGLAYY